eukprot:Phypoly_transcript_31309.p1 GENE.Phypoly_transcript_31309~~Phypoly_transcript_31309.p1  ORF type:complete len:131 (+),score=29.32 Phypoly_transcript_31309:43-393(+)
MDHLPPSLTELKLAKDFNQPLDHLPLSLKYLNFHFISKFQQHVDYLPPSLTFLALPSYFQQPVDHLPLSLNFLTFSNMDTQDIFFLPPFLSKIITNARVIPALRKMMPNANFQEIK